MSTEVKRRNITSQKMRNRNARMCDSQEWCAYCGSFMLREHRTIDHIIPLAEGGGGGKHNKVVVCGECNQLKSDRTLFDFLIEEGFTLTPKLKAHLIEYADYFSGKILSRRGYDLQAVGVIIGQPVAGVRKDQAPDKPKPEPKCATCKDTRQEVIRITGSQRIVFIPCRVCNAQPPPSPKRLQLIASGIIKSTVI